MYFPQSRASSSLRNHVFHSPEKNQAFSESMTSIDWKGFVVDTPKVAHRSFFNPQADCLQPEKMLLYKWTQQKTEISIGYGTRDQEPFDEEDSQIDIDLNEPILASPRLSCSSAHAQEALKEEKDLEGSLDGRYYQWKVTRLSPYERAKKRKRQQSSPLMDPPKRIKKNPIPRDEEDEDLSFDLEENYKRERKRNETRTPRRKLKSKENFKNQSEVKMPRNMPQTITINLFDDEEYSIDSTIPNSSDQTMTEEESYKTDQHNDSNPAGSICKPEAPELENIQPPMSPRETLFSSICEELVFSM